MTLEGKRVLTVISGASRGIGKEIAVQVSKRVAPHSGTEVTQLIKSCTYDSLIINAKGDSKSGNGKNVLRRTNIASEMLLREVMRSQRTTF